MTDARIAQSKLKLLDALEKTCNITKACKLAGFPSTRTFYNYMRDDQEFHKQALISQEMANEGDIDLLNDALLDSALGRNGEKKHVIATIFASKAKSRMSKFRVFSDAPPPVIQIEEKTTSKPLNETSSALQDLMSKFVKDVAKTEQSATAIDGETTPTEQPEQQRVVTTVKVKPHNPHLKITKPDQ